MNYTMTQSDAEELAQAVDYLPQFVTDRILEEWDCESFDVAVTLEGAFIREYEHILPRAEVTHSEDYGAECVHLRPVAYDDVEAGMDLRLKGADLSFTWSEYYADVPIDPETELTVAEWRVAVQCATDRYNSDYMERATK